LLVEDEEDLASALKDNLELEDFSVSLAHTAEDALRAVAREEPSLILLDIMLPGMNGFDFCRSLRDRDINIPIIILSARSAELDKVLGLELGADDYVTKPFSVRELIARVKAVLRRRSAAAAPDTCTVGNIEVDFNRFIARGPKGELPLSYYECEILKLLVSNPGVPVSRTDIIRRIWGYNAYPTTRTVDNHIVKLRRKLEESPERPRHILTVHGIGYKFVQ
jgi:DNA-binding response OmpR family regulator